MSSWVPEADNERPGELIVTAAVTGTTITAAQRDILYDEIVLHLSGIEGFWYAMTEREFKTAKRLAEEFADDLRVLLDDLGFGEGTGQPVELTSAAVVRGRVMRRLGDYAKARARTEAERREDAECSRRQNQLVQDTIREVLDGIDAGQRG